MDVSIRRAKPDGDRVVRRRSFTWLTLLAVLGSGLLAVPAAQGFTIQHVQFGNNLRLRPDDILDNGMNLGRGSEQVFDEGTLQTSLADFAEPIDVNIGGTLAGGSLTASVDRLVALTVQLSNDERRDCLGNEDFAVTLRVVAPRRDAFVAVGPDGGELEVLNFLPVYRGGIGGACPRNLIYGYRIDLAVDRAISAGDYVATAEIEVRSLVPGGAVEVAQEPVDVHMPGLLLLYHYSQINVDLEAGALAGALGARAACGNGFCLDLGGRLLNSSTLGGPVPVGLSADASTFIPVQTLTLRNAVGVRATGCAGSRYDTATYQVLNPGGGVLPGTRVLDGIQSQPCGLTLRTGDLSVELDLTQVDSASARASATLQITVTGL